jgi:hypothetical protein
MGLCKIMQNANVSDDHLLFLVFHSYSLFPSGIRICQMNFPDIFPLLKVILVAYLLPIPFWRNEKKVVFGIVNMWRFWGFNFTAGTENGTT